MSEDVDFRERARELREQMHADMLERGPLCPEDLPPEVWAAVAANYDAATWEPGPAYHIEYRDAWIAVEAYKALQSKVD